jgi:hypothetical protein
MPILPQTGIHACDPEVQTLTRTMAAGPEAVYLIATHTRNWQIVAVGR